MPLHALAYLGLDPLLQRIDELLRRDLGGAAGEVRGAAAADAHVEGRVRRGTVDDVDRVLANSQRGRQHAPDDRGHAATLVRRAGRDPESPVRRASNLQARFAAGDMPHREGDATAHVGRTRLAPVPLIAQDLEDLRRARLAETLAVEPRLT